MREYAGLVVCDVDAEAGESHLAVVTREWIIARNMPTTARPETFAALLALSRLRVCVKDLHCGYSPDVMQSVQRLSVFSSKRSKTPENSSCRSLDS